MLGERGACGGRARALILMPGDDPGTLHYILHDRCSKSPESKVWEHLQWENWEKTLQLDGSLARYVEKKQNGPKPFISALLARV